MSNHSRSAPSVSSDHAKDEHPYPDPKDIAHLRLSQSSIVLTEEEIESVLPAREDESAWIEIQNNLDGKLKIPILETINSTHFPSERHQHTHMRLIAARVRVWISTIHCILLTDPSHA